MEVQTNFREILQTKGRLVYHCRGVSMLPLLRQKRDVLIIEKKTERCKRLDVALFVRPDGKYIVHRVLKVFPDGYWIVGDNCVSGENVREEQVLGVMTAVKRGGRMLQMNNWGLRLYAHLWCDAYPVRFLALRTVCFIKRKLRALWKRIKQ